MKNKLSEILKGHEGDILWSPCYGKVKYIGEDKSGGLVIEANGKKHTLNSETGAHPLAGNSGECMIYPSKDTYNLDDPWFEYKLSDREREALKIWRENTHYLGTLSCCTPGSDAILIQTKWESENKVIERLFGSIIPKKKPTLKISLSYGDEDRNPGEYTKVFGSISDASDIAGKLRRFLDDLCG